MLLHSCKNTINISEKVFIVQHFAIYMLEVTVGDHRKLSQGKGVKLWLVESFKELDVCSHRMPTSVHGKEAQLTTPP
jgi:hypothetical protein